MTFEEYKVLHGVESEVFYHNHSIIIPDSAMAIEEPHGTDIDGDVVGNQFVCFAYNTWWAWPLKYHGVAKKIRERHRNLLKEPK